MGNNGQLPGKKSQNQGVNIIARKKNRSYSVRRETYPHFRYYKRSGHPALIVGEHSPKEYKYRKVMHSSKDGKRNNERVYPNPDKRDKEPMYIAKRVRHDEKNAFEAHALSWKYPNKDKKM